MNAGESETHDLRWGDDVAAFALGALPEAEMAEFREHLHGCELCERRLRWLAPAVDVLPESVPQVEPPPQLRERLLATVAAEAPAPAPAPARRRRRLPSLRGLAPRPAFSAAAVAVAIVAAGAIGWALHGSAEPREIAASVAPGAAGAEATLVVREDGAILHVHRMPQLHEDEVFQIWIRDDAVVEPSTLFVVGRGGNGEAAIGHSLEGADEVLVTREPSGGSKTPTSQPLLTTGL